MLNTVCCSRVDATAYIQSKGSYDLTSTLHKREVGNATKNNTGRYHLDATSQRYARVAKYILVCIEKYTKGGRKTL